MSKIQITLAIIIIICFSFGIWPISLAALGALIYISKNQPATKPKEEPTIESLKKENEALRKELGEQAVRHAIEKADSRERDQ